MPPRGTYFLNVQYSVKIPNLAYMSNVGRPTDYRPEYCEQVEKLCKLGATDKEIADFFDVAESTINLWKTEHPGFSESIKKGKLVADAEVAEALHKRALGYQYREVTYEKIGAKEDTMEVGEEGMESIEEEQYKKKVVVKEVPPDVAAQNIWLKNRRGRVQQGAQRWADKHEVTGEGGGPLTGPAVIVQMPPGTNIDLPENTEEPDNMDNEPSPPIPE